MLYIKRKKDCIIAELTFRGIIRCSKKRNYRFPWPSLFPHSLKDYSKNHLRVNFHLHLTHRMFLISNEH